jgi:hypothetical protein
VSDARDDPTNAVRIEADGVWRAVIDECVICGDTHRHGAVDVALLERKPSHRVRHCDPDVDGASGYYLELPEDADPPAEWRRQVARRTQGGETA